MRSHPHEFRHERFERWPHRPHFPLHEHWPRSLRTKRRLLARRMFFFFFLVFVLSVIGAAALVWLAYSWISGQAESSYMLLLSLAAILVFLFLGMIGTGALFFRGIGSPLAAIMAAADAVAAGDLSVRVPETGPREIARLARSFNRMVGELERSDLQRRNLTADVAHELRTPLHIIQGNLEGMLDAVYPADDEHIQATLEETRLLTRLVDDLQTLSLAESGQLSLKKEPLNIGELIADVQTSFSSRTQSLGIDLRLQLPEGEDGMIITADPERLDQVLGNLVSNALRHTPAGGVVTLSAEPLTEGVRIQVSDSGEGIPPEDLPYIFDRFWRGERSRSRAGGGSGLGLAICKHLVSAMGGTIEAGSQPGHGSTFTIDLPLNSLDD